MVRNRPSKPGVFTLMTARTFFPSAFDQDSVIEFKVDISENEQPISSCRFSSRIGIIYEFMTGGFTAYIDVVKDEDEGVQNIQQFLNDLYEYDSLLDRISSSLVVNFDTTEQRQLFQTMFFMPGDRQAYEEFIQHLLEIYKYDKVKYHLDSFKTCITRP